MPLPAACLTRRREAISRTIWWQPRPTRILLAEDNRTNQLVLGKILEHAGHEVDIVASGEDVLDSVSEQRYGLLLLDLNMPGMGGFETIKLLRFTEPPHELPPIVALTADATDETRQEALQLGFSDYVTKPVDSPSLLHTIDRLVSPAMVKSTAVKSKPGDPALVKPVRSAPAEPTNPVRARPRAESLPHPASPSVGSVLDNSKIESLILLDNGDGFFAQVVDDYLADAAGLIEELQLDSMEGRTQEFRDHAHALKSSSAHIGASRLFERCLGWRDLDDHALAMRARAELEQLRRDYADVRAELIERKRQYMRQASGDHRTP